MTPEPEDLDAEYRALRRGVGAHLVDREVVLVSGPAAAGYLQGQLSQDVAPLEPGASAPSLLLEPDGKLCALVRVTRLGEDFALDVDRGYGSVVEARLRRFRLRTKVDLELVEWPCVGLRGSGVAASLGLPQQAGGEPPWTLPVEWNGTSGVDVLGPGAPDAVSGEARWCGDAAWEALRIEAGIPAMGAELDDRTIAAEAGLVERTVSFTKGCYTGQELIARLDARGNRVPRRLCGVVGEISAGATLWAPGRDKPVGRCTSAAWCPGLDAVAGLAYVHRSVELPAALEWSSGPDVREPAGRVDARGLPLVGGGDDGKRTVN